MKQSNLVEFIRYQLLAMIEEEKVMCDAMKEEYHSTGKSYFDYAMQLSRTTAIIDCTSLLNECCIIFEKNNAEA